jgi:bifunctional ADP-heptose synthase (sugar kinase/adenylyltransferase)
MVKNPHLLKNLRKRERKTQVSFDQKVQRYEEMYEMAKLLNPDHKENERHLNHIIHLAKKLRNLSKLEQNVKRDSIQDNRPS